jgi:hypothetical protein
MIQIFTTVRKLEEEGEEAEGGAEDAEGEGLPFAVAEVGFAAEEGAIIRITKKNVE